LRIAPILCALGAVGAASAVGGVVATGSPAQSGDARTFVVLLDPAASTAQATQSIQAAGGTVEQINTAVGVATVRSTNGQFIDDALAKPGVDGAATDRSIGSVPDALQRHRDNVEVEHGPVAPSAASPPVAGPGEPLAAKQWDMQAIHATVDGSYREQQGSHDVRVGIIDTGIDASHPDIAPNFDNELSRNFTVDDPAIDGSCASDPDGSCNDPANVDENEHGTHVAGTIGAPINGIGIAGVAPRVDLVNLRAGQDSGYFFLQPVVNALTYAGDHGIDVVNMSFYIDPWLYNCAANPADTPQQQQEQRTIITATQRALDYARGHGVSLVAAAGNENTDLGRPQTDDTSPDYPSPAAAHHRTVDNMCLSMPTEANGVIGVTSIGPSGRKAYYSNYGIEQADVAAPGGDRRDFYGTDRYNTPENRILAPYPESVGRAAGTIAADGTPTTPLVVKDTENGRTGYYTYLQGTSMASPHTVGVVALIVAQYGKADRSQGGLTLAPAAVENILQRSATDTPCPTPRQLHYPDPDLGPEYDAYCAGSPRRNGFYGDGVVDALSAIHAGGRRPGT
jgi:subtilisin family serine protease